MRWTLLLGWELIPVYSTSSLFTLIFLINYDFEIKLLQVTPHMGYLGPILLGLAVAIACFAAAVLYGVRSSWKYNNFGAHFTSVVGIFVALMLTLAAWSLVVLGPAAITMIEQTKKVSSQP